MANLLANTTDTPLAALKRGEAFWRYQRYVTVGTTAPYFPLGNIKPAAIQIGSSSWVDAYRLWYAPTGRPQELYFQDVSVRCPVTAPTSFYATPITLTNSVPATVLDPGLVIYVGQNSNDLTESIGSVSNNYPVAPRIVTANSSTVVDLIVYFQQPTNIPTTRTPLNNGYEAAVGVGKNTTYPARLNAAVAPSATIWSAPGYGRNKVNWSITTSAAMEWEFYGVNLGTATQSRLIASGTTGVATTEAYVNQNTRFDTYQLKRSATAGANVSVDFTFELED